MSERMFFNIRAKKSADENFKKMQARYAPR
jgi:hypothetical protein